MKQRLITVTEEQDEFLRDQRHWFNFSKFVRGKLSEYIEFKIKLEERI